MNTHDIDIELPPLPEWSKMDNLGGMVPSEIRQALAAYACAAIEADRKRRGEPVAWYTEDHLTDKSATTYDPVVAERWRAKGWPVSPLFQAPRAAEPVKRKRRYAQGTALGEFGIIPMCDQVDDV
jgi:hypothetical protein